MFFSVGFGQWIDVSKQVVAAKEEMRSRARNLLEKLGVGKVGVCYRVSTGLTSPLTDRERVVFRDMARFPMAAPAEHI